MKVKSTLFQALLMVTMLIGGCKEIPIRDGRVPDQYLSQAKQLAGTYVGNFDGKKARIEIIFEENRPRIIYKDSLGNDLIHPRCHSSILDLSKVVVSKHRGRYQLDKVIFAFHPGTCTQIIGRTIALKFSGHNKFTLSLNDRINYVRDCNYEPYPGYGGYPGYYPGDPRYPFCRTDEYRHYMSGRFFKITP
jgi:hypothetical protein